MAAAKAISVDAAIAAVLAELDSNFALKSRHKNVSGAFSRWITLFRFISFS